MLSWGGGIGHSGRVWMCQGEPAVWTTRHTGHISLRIRLVSTSNVIMGGGDWAQRQGMDVPRRARSVDHTAYRAHLTEDTLGR